MITGGRSPKPTCNQLNRFNRRRFLAEAGAAGAGLALAPALLGQTKPSPPSSLKYTFANRTNGKFSDEQCFWSLDNGKAGASVSSHY
jgi:hypothetical protein